MVKKNRTPPGTDGSPPRLDDGADPAFNIWLERNLKQAFDSVANEPIPEELLRLIEEHRRKMNKRASG